MVMSNGSDPAVPTLVQRSDCPFCWKVRLAFAEAGLPYRVRPRVAEERIGPDGTVPVLLDGDLVIWESAVIAERVAELAPAAGLMPNDPDQRARVRLLHSYSDRVAGIGLREVIFEKRSKPREHWDVERITEGTRRWESSLEWLEGELGDHSYFGGGTFSLADCALVPRFHLAEQFGLPLGARHRRLTQWLARARQRPSFLATRPEETSSR